MKTVQEYFKEANTDDLIKLYLQKYPVKIHEIKDTEQSVADLIQFIYKKLSTYIQRLRTIEPLINDEPYVLFAHKTMGKFGHEISFSLASAKDIMEKDVNNIQTYSYTLSKHEEIVQYQVADTELTKHSLQGLLVDVMYEASFFGYEQEYLDAEKAALDERLKKSMDKEGMSFEAFEKKMCDEFGWEKPEKDEIEEEHYNKAVCTVYDYEKYSITKELNAIKKMKKEHLK